VAGWDVGAVSEHSVAEIIGWKYVDNPRFDGHWKEPARQVRTPDGQHWDTSKQPTVDDMLAWLRDRGIDVEVHAFRSATGLPLRVRLDEGDARRSFDGRTVLAALEAAVRFVGRAS